MFWTADMTSSPELKNNYAVVQGQALSLQLMGSNLMLWPRSRLQRQQPHSTLNESHSDMIRHKSATSFSAPIVTSPVYFNAINQSFKHHYHGLIKCCHLLQMLIFSYCDVLHIRRWRLFGGVGLHVYGIVPCECASSPWLDVTAFFMSIVIVNPKSVVVSRECWIKSSPIMRERNWMKKKVLKIRMMPQTVSLCCEEDFSPRHSLTFCSFANIFQIHWS